MLTALFVMADGREVYSQADRIRVVREENDPDRGIWIDRRDGTGVHYGHDRFQECFIMNDLGKTISRTPGGAPKS